MKKMGIFALLIFVLVLAACGGNGDKDSSKDGNKSSNGEGKEVNVNKEDFPIVDDELELKVFVAKSLTNVNSDWNDLFFWNEYEKQTNIKIDWEQVPGDSLEEKRNLALSGGKLPDVFFATRMPNTDVLKYGSQGTLLALNDLIEEYAPNFKKIMNENPEIEKALTFPDGNIYSLPNLYDPEFTSLVMNATPWINQDWLDELDMDMPETTDEFYEFLSKSKGIDFNGDGEANESPFGAYGMIYLNRWLRGSFGVGNKGVSYIDLDPDTNDVRFYATDNGYKELLEYMHKLYDEKLINQNIYSIEFNQFLTDAQEGQYGSTVWYSPPMEFGEAGKNFVGMPALEGPHGDRFYSDISHPVAFAGQFMITNKNANPEATMRWIDHFYSDEGAKFYYMGVEGETFEVAEDGSLQYVDKIANPPEGSTLNEELVKYLPWVGSSSPGIIKAEYFQGTETSEPALDAAEVLEPYFVDEVWPSDFTYTVDENKRLSVLKADIEKFVDEMTDKFITGEESFSNWDKYVEQLEKMGLEEYLEIKQAAYERTLN